MLPVSATALLATSAIIEEMPLEHKVGQIMMVHFNGCEANEDARFLVEQLGVGGIIYYKWANGLDSLPQVRHLSAGLQKMAKIPLLIAADQEGGRVVRLEGEGFTKPPSAQQIGSDNHPDLARRWALQVGEEMLAAGVNTNLAPVVDVNSNPDNPVIGDRSYGNTVSIVSALAKKAIEGYQQAGILTTIKHFPGHGDTKTDSHTDLPVVEKLELAPFEQLAPFSDMVMTAHLMAPSLDPVNCTTLSEPSISKLRQMGAKVIMTDSLIMEGVLKQARSVDQAAILAFNAGHDILLLGGKQLAGQAKRELSLRDIEQIHAALVLAVKTGEIKEARLNESVKRILELKAEKKLRTFADTR